MTGKEAAELMLFSHQANAEVVFGSYYHFSPFNNTVTLIAIDRTLEQGVANCLHEAAHAIQFHRNKWKIYFNSVVRNSWFKKLFTGLTYKIESEANDLASKWLLENQQRFPNLNIKWIVDTYYNEQLKAYA